MNTSLWVCAALFAAPVGAPPPSVVLDWDANVLRVRGVGAPRLLSPTGHLHEGDPVEAARRSLANHLRASLVRPKHLDDVRWSAWVEATVARLVAGTPRRFSDGTVWLDASARIEPRLSDAPTAVIAPQGTPRVAGFELVDARGDRCAIGAGGDIALLWRTRDAGAPARAPEVEVNDGTFAAAEHAPPSLVCGTLRAVEVNVP